jgi:hypothetical protein
MVGHGSESWSRLVQNADTIATQRLSDYHQLFTTCVAQFHDDASAQVEDLEGHASEEGLGLEMFKGLTNVLMAAFPVEKLVEEVAAEAIKSFRDVFVAGVSQAAASTSAGRVAHAKDELRRQLNELVYATRTSSEAAWSAGQSKISASLDAFSDANPHYHTLGDLLVNEADWKANAEWLADQIGILNAFVVNPTPELTDALWKAFHHDYYRISAQVRWADRSDHEQMVFVRDMEPSQRFPFLTMMGIQYPDSWLAGHFIEG